MKKETRNAIIGGFAMTALSGVLNPIIQTATSSIVDKMTHKVNINDYCYIMEAGITKYFTSLPDVFYLNMANEPDFKKNTNYWQPVGNSRSTIWWGGYPITFSMQDENDSERQQRCHMWLSTLNTKPAIENMKHFIKHCVQLQHQHMVNKSKSDVSVYGTGRRMDLCRFVLTPFVKRTFSNTFIPDEQEKLIKESLDKFVERRDWYMENHIPYHFGFLLYGEAGTGKTTVAQAIADHIGAELTVFPGDAINDFPKIIGTDFDRVPIDPRIYRVICIEDVDCGFAQSRMDTYWEGDEEKEVKRKVGLAEILNCIDGLQAPQNVIYVLTTNHIEKLDPALIRPGRCDVKLEIPTVTLETLIKFCKHHYPNENHTMKWWKSKVPTIKDGITFAEIKTYVMKGATLTELCDKVKFKEVK